MCVLLAFVWQGTVLVLTLGSTCVLFSFGSRSFNPSLARMPQIDSVSLRLRPPVYPSSIYFYYAHCGSSPFVYMLQGVEANGGTFRF